MVLFFHKIEYWEIAGFVWKILSGFIQINPPGKLQKNPLERGSF